MSTSQQQLTIQPGHSDKTADITAAWRADIDAKSAAVADLVPAQDLDALPAGSGMLVVTRGPNTGAQFRLDRPVTYAGRHPLSDIYLDDITVSRRHAEIRRENGEFHVVDRGSRNNTYLNREQVESAVLANGDEVQMGNFRLVFFTATP